MKFNFLRPHSTAAFIHIYILCAFVSFNIEIKKKKRNDVKEILRVNITVKMQKKEDNNEFKYIFMYI